MGAMDKMAQKVNCVKWLCLHLKQICLEVKVGTDEKYNLSCFILQNVFCQHLFYIPKQEIPWKISTFLKN